MGYPVANKALCMQRLVHEDFPVRFICSVVLSGSVNADNWQRRLACNSILAWRGVMGYRDMA